MNNRKQSPRNNMNGRNRQPRNNNGGSQNTHTQRMTFKQSIDKYTALSKEASSLGDTITAEHYRQYAEHYRREYNEWLIGNQHLFEKQKIVTESLDTFSETTLMKDVDIDLPYLKNPSESITLQDNKEVSYNVIIESQDENPGNTLPASQVVKTSRRGRKPKPKDASE